MEENLKVLMAYVNNSFNEIMQTDYIKFLLHDDDCFAFSLNSFLRENSKLEQSKKKL